MNDLLTTRADEPGGPLLVTIRKEENVPRATKAHKHARGQLLSALRGLLTIGTEEGQWVVPATHAVWLPPRHLHSAASHGPYSGWSVYVEETACAGLPTRPRIIQTKGLLREAVARAADIDSAAPTEFQIHLAGIIFHEINSLPEEHLGLSMPTDPRLLKIAQAVISNPADNRTLQDWALWAGASPRTVTRRFPAETGFSFTEWRQRARLLRALELLFAGRSVTSIALDLGYETVSAFIALFRRTLGATPVRYLQLQR